MEVGTGITVIGVVGDHPKLRMVFAVILQHALLVDDAVAFRAIAIFTGQSFIQSGFHQIVYSLSLLSVCLYKGCNHVFGTAGPQVSAGDNIRLVLMLFSAVITVHETRPP